MSSKIPTNPLSARGFGDWAGAEDDDELGEDVTRVITAAAARRVRQDDHRALVRAAMPPGRGGARPKKDPPDTDLQLALEFNELSGQLRTLETGRVRDATNSIRPPLRLRVGAGRPEDDAD